MRSIDWGFWLFVVLMCLVVMVPILTVIFLVVSDGADRSQEAVAMLQRAGYQEVRLTPGATCQRTLSWGAFFVAVQPGLEKHLVQGTVCCDRGGCSLRF